MAQTTSLVFNGGVIPSPTPVPSGAGKAKLLKIGEITITEQGAQVTKNVICDPDSVTSVAPFMEVLTSAKLAELVEANSVLVLNDGSMQYLMADASITVEDETAVCTSVSFLGLSKEHRAKVTYPCTRVTDELTLQQVIEVGEPVETAFNLVSADSEDDEPGTLIDKLEVVDNVRDPEDPTILSLEVTVDGQGKRKVAINEDYLRTFADNITNAVFDVVDTLDSMDFDEVPHAYLSSSLFTSSGDPASTGSLNDVFRCDSPLVGDCFEFEQTTTIDNVPFGYIWIEPGTYIVNASVTLQWVGSPRGTFMNKVGNVMGENFDFSQEQELVRSTTRITTIPTRTKLAVNVTYDAGTPPMGFWVKSLQVVKLAGGMSQTNVTHDSTLTGQGSVADPLGVTSAAFDKVKDIPTSIVAFRTGDVIPVGGPNGPAKMPASDLQDAILGGPIDAAVRAWLDAHPEATTTVQDNSITDDKLVPNLKFNRAYSGTNRGHVVLDKDLPFASQVTEPDTTYEIRWNFDLGGNSFTIPNGAEFYFNGGSVYNGTLVGVLYTVTPLDMNDLGVKYGAVTDSGAETNFNRVGILSGITNLIDLHITGTVYFKGDTEVHLNSVNFIGHGNTCYFAKKQFAMHGDFTVTDLTFRSHGTNASCYSLEDEANRSAVIFKNCRFIGDLRVFKSNRLAQNETPMRGISHFALLDCTGEECRYTGGANNVFYLANTYFNWLQVEGCDFHNCPTSLIQAGLTNDSPQAVYIWAHENERLTTIRNSKFHDDEGFSYQSYGITSITYADVITLECGAAVVENNVFDNLVCDVHDAAAYDCYLSTSWVIYRGNYWRNCININDLADIVNKTLDSDNINHNTLIKSKGVRLYRLYENNEYVVDYVDPRFPELVGFVGLTDDSSAIICGTTIIRNNSFRVKCWYSNRAAEVRSYNTYITGNTIIIDSLAVHQDDGLFNSPLFAGCNFNVTFNVVSVTDAWTAAIERTGGASFVGVSDLNSDCTVRVANNDVRGIFSSFVCAHSGLAPAGEVTVNNNSVRMVASTFATVVSGVFLRLNDKVRAFENQFYNIPIEEFISRCTGLGKMQAVLDANNTTYAITNITNLVANGASKKLLVKVLECDICLFTGEILLAKDAQGVLTVSAIISDKSYAVLTSNTSLYTGEYSGGGTVRCNGSTAVRLTLLPGQRKTVDISLVDDTYLSLPASATTTSINTWASVKKGTTVFDETRGKQIVWNGTAWTNMDGSAI